MAFVKKYWYICFSIFALLILVFHTFCVCKRHNLPAWKVHLNYHALCWVVIAIPSFIFHIFLQPIVDARIFFMGFYVLGGCATYLHARFREEHGI
jgi:hypothetical protein